MSHVPFFTKEAAKQVVADHHLMTPEEFELGYKGHQCDYWSGLIVFVCPMCGKLIHNTDTMLCRECKELVAPEPACMECWESL